MDASIHGDSSAAACSENHRKHDMPAHSGAVSGFGNRQAVRIVGAADFATERLA